MFYQLMGLRLHLDLKIQTVYYYRSNYGENNRDLPGFH